MRFQYMIGTTSYSREYSLIENTFFLKKQFSLSIPLITGVKIKNGDEIKNIYVGKEIDLKEISQKKQLLEKYDIAYEDLSRISILGFKRACILNFKRCDTLLVGVEKDAIVVPDYFALKKIIETF